MCCLPTPRRLPHAQILRLQCHAGTRPAQTKAAFFAALAAELASAGVRREDLLVTLTENGRQDWSLGLGEAQLLDEHLMRRHGWALPTA
ncbi:MAG: tautomerase family protein [Proteobacteria bacterium]|nr:hypothetical protein [Methylibium sp.]MBY0368662.1 tautomerase family protein [Burkholderiaceae bacterium]MCH8857396.1 tautomerase family protein [Pseudomonadota bacterium]